MVEDPCLQFELNRSRFSAMQAGAQLVRDAIAGTHLAPEVAGNRPLECGPGVRFRALDENIRQPLGACQPVPRKITAY